MIANGNSSNSREVDNGFEWSTEDELRFQATQVVGSLVNGEQAHLHHVEAISILTLY